MFVPVAKNVMNCYPTKESKVKIPNPYPRGNELGNIQHRLQNGQPPPGSLVMVKTSL